MRPHHRMIGPFLGLALALFVTGPSRAGDREPETPDHAYQIRVTCAGAAAAAVAESDMVHSGSEKERTDARALMADTRAEALRSGEGIGRSAAQVDEAVDRSRDGVLGGFGQVAGNPDALAKEKADLGRVVIACALVETLARRGVRKATPAPGDPSPR